MVKISFPPKLLDNNLETVVTIGGERYTARTMHIYYMNDAYQASPANPHVRHYWDIAQVVNKHL